MDEDRDSPFHEFHVLINTVGDYSEKPVMIIVWTSNIEDAMTCGEVLSGVYLNA